jgi:hypothetical protein
MSHGIDASMHTMQASRKYTIPDRFFADARPAQLIDRYHPVLPLSDLRDQHVGSGDFPVHIRG